MVATGLAALERLSIKLSEEIGIHYPVSQLSEMERLLQPVAEKLGHRSVKSMAEAVLDSDLSPSELAVFAQCLTIGETFFFREDSFWKHFESTLLPQWLSDNGVEPLNIWSAACCTGEEPYTAAIIVKRVLNNGTERPVKIWGSDINSSYLQRAREARYTTWALRSTDAAVLADNFIAIDKNFYTLVSQVQQRVQFFAHNLVDAEAQLPLDAPPFDLILLRNVLMYFNQKQTEAVIDRLCKFLKPDGWLCVSPQDLWRVPRDKYVRYGNRSIFMLRGREAGDQRAAGLRPSAKPTIKPGVKPSLGPSVGPTAGPTTKPSARPSSNKEWQKDPLELASQQPARAEGRLQDKSSGTSGDKPPGEHRAVNQADSSGAQPPLLSDEDYDALNSRAFKSATSVHDLIAAVHRLTSCGDLLSAFTWTESGIALHPLEEALYFLKASILQELGAPEQAIGALKQAIFLKPDFIMAHFCMFNLLLQQNNSAAAVKHLDNAILALEKIGPADTVPHSDGLTAGEFLQITRFMRS